MYIVELRKFGNMIKTFEDLDDAFLYYMENKKNNNAVLYETKEFIFAGKTYYDSFSQMHQIHAILNSEYRFLCKYDPQKTTKENAAKKYLLNDHLIF